MKELDELKAIKAKLAKLKARQTVVEQKAKDAIRRSRRAAAKARANEKSGVRGRAKVRAVKRLHIPGELYEDHVQCWLRGDDLLAFDQLLMAHPDEVAADLMRRLVREAAARLVGEEQAPEDEKRCTNTVADDDGDTIATCTQVAGHEGKCGF